MDRHTFVAGVLSGLAAPITAGAQQAGKVYRIGWINTASPGWQDDAFRERLRELGYSEGQNIVTDWRWVEGRFDQLPRIAAELVNLKVDLIVAGGTSAARRRGRRPPRFRLSWWWRPVRSRWDWSSASGGRWATSQG